MRYLYLALIILLTALVLVFTGQNLQLVTVSFLNMRGTLPLSILVLAVYVFGMFTGGSVLALLRTWVKRARS
jgi:lipopolysaccharide assembly protein A